VLVGDDLDPSGGTVTTRDIHPGGGDPVQIAGIHSYAEAIDRSVVRVAARRAFRPHRVRSPDHEGDKKEGCEDRSRTASWRTSDVAVNRQLSPPLA